MILGYYPDWDRGFVSEYLTSLKTDGQRKKAVARLEMDLQKLLICWPLTNTMNITVKHMPGHEPLRELVREWQGIAYRLFFCVRGTEIWVLHAIEKKQNKTPTSDITLAARRMQDVLTGKVRRP